VAPAPPLQQQPVAAPAEAAARLRRQPTAVFKGPTSITTPDVPKLYY